MPRKPAASPAPELPAGALAKQSTISNSSIKISPELDKCDGVVLFPEKVKRANEIITKTGLPKIITENFRNKNEHVNK